MTKLERKKGIQGIFNRTNVPKLDIDTPTENAKNIENTKENINSGCDVRRPKNRQICSLNKRNTVNRRMKVFSKEEMNITIFFTSKSVGLNKVAKIAL